MRFATVVLTAPRPTSTLKRTLGSLRDGGFFAPIIFDGSPPPGEATSPKWCTAAYQRVLRESLTGVLSDNTLEGLLVFEDDVIVCKGLREYLLQLPWPEEPRKIAAASPYCCTAYSNYKPFPKWHREDQRTVLAGTQAFIYTRQAIELLVDYLKPDRRSDDERSYAGIDVQLGWFAKDAGLHVWYHIPSLVQHIGINNSAVGFGDCGSIYRAETFVGEDFDAGGLL